MGTAVQRECGRGVERRRWRTCARQYEQRVPGEEKPEEWQYGQRGGDLSLLEFKAIEYKRKGNAVADDEHLARIAKVHKREFMRRGINQHTLEKMSEREPVRVVKLAECLQVLEEYELEQEKLARGLLNRPAS